MTTNPFSWAQGLMDEPPTFNGKPLPPWPVPVPTLLLCRCGHPENIHWGPYFMCNDACEVPGCGCHGFVESKSEGVVPTKGIGLESYGQIGYEAYGNAGNWKTFDGRDMPDWDNLSTTEVGRETQRRWEIAAAKIRYAI